MKHPNELPDELPEVLIAISKVAKRLAKKMKVLKELEKGEKSNGNKYPRHRYCY